MIVCKPCSQPAELDGESIERDMIAGRRHQCFNRRLSGVINMSIVDHNGPLEIKENLVSDTPEIREKFAMKLHKSPQGPEKFFGQRKRKQVVGYLDPDAYADIVWIAEKNRT